MGSRAKEREEGFPSTSFGALFSIAYRRIWASRGLRGWEVFLWSVMATYVAAVLHHYNSFMISRHLFAFSRLALVLLTPILVGIWVYRVHASMGMADESLKTIPEHAVRILVARTTAVMVAWLQFFAPVLVMFFAESERGFSWNPWGEFVLLSVVWAAFQTIGWALCCAGWACLVGSLGSGKGSSFFFPYFAVVIAIVLIPTLTGMHEWFGLAAKHQVSIPYWSLIKSSQLPYETILPEWLQIAGIVGIPAWCVALLFAGSRWGRKA